MKTYVANREANPLDAIIKRAQRQEAEAFDEIVDRYAHRLFAFLRRHTGHSEDAQDLVQEVFVRVVRTISRYQHDGKFEAWLFRIAMNLARDRGRRQSRAPEMVSMDSLPPDENGSETGWEQIGATSDTGIEAAPSLSEDVDLLQRCIAQLPECEREVILLRHYSQMSFAEIADLMGTPLGTALARAHRGLGKLRQWMES